MVIVFTGNGKGKTTAALGQMVRVAGRGKRALMIQFIKGPWRAGEDEFAPFFKMDSNTFAVRKRGLGFVGILGDTRPKEEHAAAARAALEEFKKEAASGAWQLIVLDEVNVAVSLGLLEAKDVLEAIEKYPEDKLLILSGRGAPQEFIDRADLATEMKEIKHPFGKGKKAAPGVEF